MSVELPTLNKYKYNTIQYTGARVSSTYARTHVPTPRRFLSKPSAAFYVYLFLLLFLCLFFIFVQEKEEKRKEK